MKSSFNGGDFVDAYNQTQAEMARFREFQDEPGGVGEQWSSLLNSFPIAGAIKLWSEANSGRDLVTGQWIHRSDWATLGGVGLNLLGTVAMGSGFASRVAAGAAFSGGGVALGTVGAEAAGAEVAGAEVAGMEAPAVLENGSTEVGSIVNKNLSGDLSITGVEMQPELNVERAAENAATGELVLITLNRELGVH